MEMLLLGMISVFESIFESWQLPGFVRAMFLAKCFRKFGHCLLFRAERGRRAQDHAAGFVPKAKTRTNKGSIFVAQG